MGKSRVRSRALLLPGRSCLANSLDLSRPDMPGEKLALFEISLRPLCVSSSCRRSVLQHPSLQQQELQGEASTPGGKGKVTAGLPPTSPLLHPRGAQPFSGLNHQSWHQHWGFLANWGMVVQVLGKWGCRGAFPPAWGPPEQHIEPPRGECPEECEALHI